MRAGPIPVGFVAAAIAVLASEAAAAPFTFRHDAVLGTSLEIVVEARDADRAGAAEQAAIAEIERLAAVASTYDPDSEISRWLATDRPAAVSRDLATILRVCDAWRATSDGVFHPGVALAAAAWRQAERDGRLPDDATLEGVADRLRGAPWEWHGDEVAPAGLPVSVDGLAKGFIVDAACAAALAVEGVRGVMVNIGGDLAVRGELEQPVEIPCPMAVGGGKVSIELAERAIATSGPGRRGFRVAGETFSHLIDPRTARPAAGIASASVIAATAADADALATVLCILPPEEGLALAERVEDAACLIVDARGGTHASRRWPQRGPRVLPVATRQDATATARWNGGFELAVDLEIIQTGGGRRYRRPYVAAWVEDKDGYPVKTLLLWVQADQPGPRWIPDLKRWTKADRLRKLAEGTDLVTTVSEPTRMPGSHGVVWDGRDTAGIPLEPGEYTICVEAVREHGSYQFDRKKVTLGTEAFSADLPAGDELGGVSIEYRRVAGGDGG